MENVLAAMGRIDTERLLDRRFLELGEEKGVVEIVTPDYLVGKSLKEAEIRQQYGLAVIAIRRKDDVVISPRAEEVIQPNDILVVLGRIANCEKLR